MSTSRTASVPARVEAHFASLRALIGDTPLVELECAVDGVLVRVFAKHEVLNLTGSTKDRMALGILREAWEAGVVHEGTMLVEATSGNTGIAFAALGRALGHPVRIYMPDWMSRERVLLIQSLGAELVPVSVQEGGLLGSIARADDFAAEQPGERFLPHQMARRLAAEFGLGLGISSGANLLGALQIGKSLGANSVVATVFPDSNKKYLSTDLMSDEPAAEGDWTPRVEFRRVRVDPRLGT